jgi:signal transduction histidine kinase
MEFIMDPEKYEKKKSIQKFSFSTLIFELSKVMSQIAKNYKRQLYIKNKVVEVDSVVTNEKTLLTVLINLIKNAIQYSKLSSTINLEI